VNKDKRVVVQVLADLCGAYRGQRTVPTKVLMVVRDAVKELALSEERSFKRMEPYKDAPGTAVNYRNAVECHHELMRAQDLLEESEIEEACDVLKRVAAPVATPAAPAPKVKASRR
jgi:hypothetical protein